jgi:hypothetical protein
MYRFFTFLKSFAICLLLANTTQAQSPQYATPIHGNNLCFPIGSGATYYKTQFLYFPGDFTTAPPTGAITQIYLTPNNSPTGSITITNLTIKIGMTALTSLPATSVYVTGLTTAYTAATTTIPQTSNGNWTTPIVLQTPVPYTNGQNFIVEIEHTGYTGSAFCLSSFNSAQTPSLRRTIYGPASSTTGGGGFNDWFGDLGLDVLTGPPCPAPTGLNASNILSASATVGWTAVSGSTGYEYIVDQNPTVSSPNTPISTVSLTANVNTLSPGTIYYLHVRNMCSPTNPSTWVDYKFTTLPPCNNPSGFFVTNLQPNSTTINWSPLASALSWDYIVDQTPATPTSPTGAINVTTPTGNVPGLMEDTKYYVHIRANCTGEQSGWSLDSFTTPIECRAPELKIDHINTDEAVTYWSAIPTAYEYEYAITTSATPPTQGTVYKFTSLHTSALKDGETYYIHVRSHCNSLNVNSVSPWATASFKTFPTGVVNANSDKFSIDIRPNPVKDILTIELGTMPGGNTTATLTDISGKTLRMVELKTQKTEINIAELPAGNYMLKYTDNEHNQVLRVTKK